MSSISSPNTGLGVNQSWQNVRAERAAGVAYQNTTSRTIFVTTGGGQSSNHRMEVSEDGLVWELVDSIAANGRYYAIGFPVPPGSYYRAHPGTPIGSWLELR
ncbi:hypothetical protein [Rhodophyticola sp.]|jgi:hypothetical protein|uniref:hypothetical protein n=1 Tax=Rhodophyticola sp. TaxID=2680032 RepID=UPI003D286B2A